MFEPLYVRPKWYRPLFSEGPVASVVIHVGACVAVLAGGASPASVAQQVTEGIIFLAPLPSPAAGPSTVTEQLRYVEFTGAVAAMADAGSELHVAPKVADSPPNLEELPTPLPMESFASIFEKPADSVYFAEQVDSPAAYDQRSAAPIYPDSLQRLGIEGSVMAQFVVDTTGHVEMESVRLLESTNLRFTESVLKALPLMLFRPATHNGQKARQIVEVPFRFRVVVRDTVPVRDVSGARPPH
jgi:TonB family protein